MSTSEDWSKIIYIDNEPFVNHTTIYKSKNYDCFSPGKQVYTDTWFACVCYQFAFVLETLGFGYITALLCTIIIIISLFGGIKENYKWFILNQAIWDLFVSYDLICNKPTTVLYSFYNFDFDFKRKAWNQGPSTCFYSTLESPYNAVYSWPVVFQQIASTTFENVQYSMTFSLAFSRFIAMYFPIFYGKYTNKQKLLKILILYNILTIFLLNLHQICDYFIKHQIIRECFCETCNTTYIFQNNCINNIQNHWWRHIIHGIRYAAMSIWLLLASIFTYAVLFKILLHIKFQYKNKQKTLSSSLRICFALFFTAFLFSLYFLFVFTQELMGNWILQILTQANVDTKITIWLAYSSPQWLLQLKATKQSLNNLRIFIECMLALTVLTGYREGFIQILKIFLYPGKILKATKMKLSGKNSTVVLPYAKNNSC